MVCTKIVMGGNGTLSKHDNKKSRNKKTEFVLEGMISHEL